MPPKRIISFVILLMFIATLLSTLTACTTAEKQITIPSVNEEVCIYDQNNTIDDNIEPSLNSMLVELEEKTGIEFVVLSIESLLHKTIEEYANEVFNALCIGKKDQDNGILLIYSKSNQKVRLEIGKDLKSCLNDSNCSHILNNFFVPYQANDNYTKATELTVKAVLNILAEEYNFDIQGIEQVIPEEQEEKISTAGIIAIIILISLIVVYSISNIFISSSDYSYGESSDKRESSSSDSTD